MLEMPLINKTMHLKELSRWVGSKTILAKPVFIMHMS